MVPSVPSRPTPAPSAELAVAQRQDEARRSERLDEIRAALPPATSANPATSTDRTGDADVHVAAHLCQPRRTDERTYEQCGRVHARPSRRRRGKTGFRGDHGGPTAAPSATTTGASRIRPKELPRHFDARVRAQTRDARESSEFATSPPRASRRREYPSVTDAASGGARGLPTPATEDHVRGLRALHPLALAPARAFVPLYNSGRSRTSGRPRATGRTAPSPATRELANQELPPRYTYSHRDPWLPRRSWRARRSGSRRAPGAPATRGLDATAPAGDTLAADISGRGGRVKKTKDDVCGCSCHTISHSIQTREPVPKPAPGAASAAPTPASPPPPSVSHTRDRAASPARPGRRGRARGGEERQAAPAGRRLPAGSRVFQLKPASGMAEASPSPCRSRRACTSRRTATCPAGGSRASRAQSLTCHRVVVVHDKRTRAADGVEPGRAAAARGGASRRFPRSRTATRARAVCFPREARGRFRFRSVVSACAGAGATSSDGRARLAPIASARSATARANAAARTRRTETAGERRGRARRGKTFKTFGGAERSVAPAHAATPARTPKSRGPTERPGARTRPPASPPAPPRRRGDEFQLGGWSGEESRSSPVVVRFLSCVVVRSFVRGGPSPKTARNARVFSASSAAASSSSATPFSTLRRGRYRSPGAASPPGGQKSSSVASRSDERLGRHAVEALPSAPGARACFAPFANANARHRASHRRGSARNGAEVSVSFFFVPFSSSSAPPVRCAASGSSGSRSAAHAARWISASSRVELLAAAASIRKDTHAAHASAEAR